LKPVHAAFRIHQLLTAREEWVAIGADFNADIALVGGARPEGVAAGADDVHFFIGGMDAGLHMV